MLSEKKEKCNYLRNYQKTTILATAASTFRIDNIKIMPCVEGDRSDCKPEASSTARSRRLRAVVVVEG